MFGDIGNTVNFEIKPGESSIENLIPTQERNRRGHRLMLHQEARYVVQPAMEWQEITVNADENPPVAESNLKLDYSKCSLCDWSRPAGTNPGDLRREYGEHVAQRHDRRNPKLYLTKVYTALLPVRVKKRR